jgi:hypothetical protein
MTLISFSFLEETKAKRAEREPEPEVKDTRDTRDNRDSRDNRDQRDSRDRRDNRDNRDGRDHRDNRDYRDDRDRYRDRDSRPRPRQAARNYPPLSTGLQVPAGVEVDAHSDSSIPYHRLYVTGLGVNLSADDVRQVFEPFGTLEFVDLHLDFVRATSGIANISLETAREQLMSSSKTCLLLRWRSTR